MAIAITLLSACGGTAISQSHSALVVAATAVQSVEREVVTRYTAAAATARESSASYDEYASRMSRWDGAVIALVATADALVIAERAIDAIEAGAHDDVRNAVACALDALMGLMGALDGLVPVPDALGNVVAILGALAGDCEVAS